jgi:putative hemolysin
VTGAGERLLRAVGLLPGREGGRPQRPARLDALLTRSVAAQLLSEQAADMIRGVLDLGDLVARDVMTPRTEVVAVPVSFSVDEAADLMLAEGHSRIPAYEESLDRVVGVVLAREVWRAQRQGVQELRQVLRPVIFVPEGKRADALLRDMLAGQVHFAVVVDEFGGTAGIVTTEDLLEQIVGEIHDEHEEASPEILEMQDGAAVISGAVLVAELNERYDLSLPEQDYTTIGGWVMGRLGRIARPGDDVLFAGGRLRVLAMDGRRIARAALVLDGAEGGRNHGPAPGD